MKEYYFASNGTFVKQNIYLYLIHGIWNRKTNIRNVDVWLTEAKD